MCLNAIFSLALEQIVELVTMYLVKARVRSEFKPLPTEAMGGPWGGLCPAVGTSVTAVMTMMIMTMLHIRNNRLIAALLNPLLR